MLPLGVLDLVPVREGETPRDALPRSLALARHTEKLGYQRFWVAEHHNMPGIASAATSVVMGYLAGGTERIRIGAGGIMLPNHAPLLIAEQFGTLESLYPGRIDLGLGRAPGTDQTTLRAMRRDPRSAEHFVYDVKELQSLLGPVEPGQLIQAVPGGGTQVPLWILGSSLYGAQVAAALGLPYAFAAHFAPDALHEALQLYREQFVAQGKLQRPHVMLGVNIVVADTDNEAARLFTTVQQGFALLHRGQRGRQRPPIDDIEQFWSPAEKAMANRMLRSAVVGSPATVRKGIEALVAATQADELLIVSNIYDTDARLRSYSLLATIAGT
ncbi:MAG: LLM class flavin-dependent oxidoreductase [Steroidobacteraceae bacterium]